MSDVLLPGCVVMAESNSRLSCVQETEGDGDKGLQGKRAIFQPKRHFCKKTSLLNKKKRLARAKGHRNWCFVGWCQVLWPDEVPEVFHASQY